MYKAFGILALMLVLFFNIVCPATASSIHYVSNEQELFALEKDADGTYILTNDIYIETPHSMMFTSSNNRFNGVLDGNGYTVYNLNIEGDNAYLAFIGFLGSKGVIKNLNFEDGIITSTSNSNIISAVVARNDGRVENCVFRGILRTPEKVYDRTEYVSLLGAGDVINSFYYLTEKDTVVSSEISSATFESVASQSQISFTESVTVVSSEPNNATHSSSNKSSSNKSSNSKLQSSSSKVEESAAVYGDTSSQTITQQEVKSTKFVFYSAVLIMFLLLGYMVYGEITFRKNQKEDKK